MKPGCVRGSILTFISSGIGGGILALPYVCKETGLLLGLSLLVIGMLATYWSFTLLIETSFTVGIKNVEHMCKAVGGKSLLWIYQIGLIVLQFGSCVSFQVISKKH